MSKDLVIGLLIPFIGTSLGSAMVYLMKNELSSKIQKSLSGFAAGVMVAASIWSLLIPAMDMVDQKLGKMAWIPAVVGFAVGIIFLLFLDNVVPHQHVDSDVAEGPKNDSLRKTTMMVLAVVIHRSFVRKYRFNNGRSYGAFTWNSNSKFSRRCNNFYAIKKSRNRKK